MKTLTLYRPNAIQQALSDFDRCFDYLARDSFLTPTTRIFNRVPAVDIRETEKTYMLEMELPGYDEKNIDIHVEGSILFIATKQENVVPPTEPPLAEKASPAESAGEQAKEEKGKGESWLLRERRVTSFSRSFKLPENANPEEINAEFKNGVLTLEIQKRAEAQKRTIEIKVK